MPSNENQSATQLPKMPSNRCPTCNHIIKRPFSGPGGKLFKAGFVGVTIALWCLPHHGERPLIVRKILEMEEFQERAFEAAAMVKAERAAERAKK